MRAPIQQTTSQAGRYLIGALIALALDATTMFTLVALELPTAVARVAALIIGITTTYWFNRAFTFETTHRASLGDWGRYVAAQSVGAALNFAVSTTGIYLLGREGWAIALSVGAGAATGFCYNFFAARKLLHRVQAKRDE